ncbi:MAG TPA: PPC domain-containing DNA-binding protein [Methanotrichaceae archaeon]|nr:PPC domain-containing DNA-binding protein [Methanotrichaceae archaeon]
MLVRAFQQGRTIMARLDYGKEIIESITAVADETGITTGTFSVIGALSQAELAYYDQQSHQYMKTSVSTASELASCTGNITIRDGKPFVHAHAVLAGSSYHAMAGHLVSGTIFAAELYLVELSGQPLTRALDPSTGLFLWDGK